MVYDLEYLTKNLHLDNISKGFVKSITNWCNSNKDVYLKEALEYLNLSIQKNIKLYWKVDDLYIYNKYNNFGYTENLIIFKYFENYHKNQMEIKKLIQTLKKK